MTTYGEFVMHCSRALFLETWAHHPTLVASTSPSVTSDFESDIEANVVEANPIEANPVEANPPAADPLQLSRYESEGESESESESESDSDSEPRIRDNLPPPMEDVFTTPEEALTAINNFTSAFGYELSVKRSVAKKGVLKHVYYTCVRGGKLRTSVDEPARKRQRTTKCIECPFDAVIHFRAATELWYLKIRNAKHNHGPMPMSTVPSHRRQQLADREDRVNAQIRAGLSTSRY
jgi:hypothetical protein